MDDQGDYPGYPTEAFHRRAVTRKSGWRWVWYVIGFIGLLKAALFLWERLS